MPTYEYACRDCGHRFDAVQSIHDDALTECPECGGSVRRVVAAVGVQFKGSGFYRTDSREATGKKSKSASAGSTSGSGLSEGSAGSGSPKATETSSSKGESGGGSGESKAGPKKNPETKASKPSSGS